MSDLNNPNVNSSTPGAPPQHPQSVGAGGPGAGGAVGGTTNVNPTGPSVQNTTAGGELDLYPLLCGHCALLGQARSAGLD